MNSEDAEALKPLSPFQSASLRTVTTPPSGDEMMTSFLVRKKTSLSRKLCTNIFYGAHFGNQSRSFIKNCLQRPLADIAFDFSSGLQEYILISGTVHDK